MRPLFSCAVAPWIVLGCAWMIGCAADDGGAVPRARPTGGTSGSAGSAGSAGASGAGGSGAAGTAGAGSSGAAGVGGAAGSSGAAGTGGASGSSGTSGTAGSSASGGAGGAGGVAGMAGSGGVSGTAGSGGAAGSAGAGATAGAGGSGAVAGAGGTAGTGGSTGCTDGATLPCYTGPDGTVGSGACKPGQKTCVSGVYGDCVGDVTPMTELCDGSDNDCDGVVDNHISGLGDACVTGLFGVCSAGLKTCDAAQGMLVCSQSVVSSSETCDGLDNNCDGTADENNPEAGQPCTNTTVMGACQKGTSFCSGGALGCTPSLPTPEVCDGVDNDCDGSVDESDPAIGVDCGCGAVQACVNGQITCQSAYTVYFYETFKDNSKGWTLGTSWQIGPAVLGGGDPASDHTTTADNGVAGTNLGGIVSKTIHDFYWLESPVFDTSSATGSVYLQFWRWLRSDYTPYMQNKVQVYDGFSWVDLPYGTTGACCGVSDTAWTNHKVPTGAPAQPTSSAEYPTQFDITAYKSATTRIRFGYNVGQGGGQSVGGWNLDDVTVASGLCP